MLNILRKSLESDEAIFDIVIYGSYVKGARVPKDIDLVVIFIMGTLRERLNKIQLIKKKLSSKIEKIDIKQMLLHEIFSASFFARTGIMLEGISVKNNKPFSEVVGFRAFTLFWYNLSGLTHTQKVKFNYILAGRNTKGIVERMDGVRLAKGVVKIPINHTLPFEQILKDNKINYKKKNILEEI
jgi:predicted nucleotidyltransferase